MADIPLRDVATPHIPIQTRWQVADLAARDALVLTAADIGGVCLVKTPPGFYDLHAVAPAAWNRRATDADLLGIAPTGRTIATTPPLTGGGDLSADRTLGILAATPTDPGAMSAAHYTKIEELPDAATLTAALVTLQSDVTALASSAWTQVASCAACAALPVSHGVAYVQSVRDLYLYRADSTATVDSITVLAAVGGVGRWERLNLTHPSWSAQPVWYLNTAGTPEADGFTPGAPVPVAEFIRRVGSTFKPRGAVTVYVAASTSEPWTQTFVRDHSGVLIIEGVPTVAFAGSISAKVDLSTVAPGTTAKATSTWTGTEFGRLVKDVTNGRYSWAQIGTGTPNEIKMATWCSFSETLGAETAGVTEGNTTVGAAVETYTLPQVSSFNWTFEGGSAPGLSGAFVVNKLEFVSQIVQSHATAANTTVSWQNCKFTLTRDIFGAGQHQFNNCWHVGTGLGSAGLPAYLIVNAGTVAGSWSNAVSTGARTVEFCKNVTLQGVGMFVTRNTYVRLRNLFVEDAGPGTVFKLLGGSQLDAAAAVVCGNGNTGAIVALSSGCRVVNGTTAAATVWRLASGAAPIKFNEQTTCPALDPATFLPSATARALTFANLDATYAAGGFGGAAFDPRQGCFFGASTAA